MDHNPEKVDFKIQGIKDKFIRERKKIENIFYKENKGLENCKRSSKIVDKLVTDLFKESLKFYNFNSKICICAVGGYGRKVLAPYSDLDILFIYKQEVAKKKVIEMIEFILFPIWDLGFKIGYAAREIEESIAISREDHVIQTSMLDTRLVCGSALIYKKVMKDFRIEISKYGSNLLKNKISERRKRIVEIGYDYFRNEPNLKESEGSLRDINFILWSLKIFKLLIFSKRKKSLLLLTNKEKKKIRLSLEFLLLIRCHLHYQSLRDNDKLSFEYQKAISKKIFKTSSHENIDNNFLVEKMMKDYFLQIRNIKNLAEILSQTIEKELKNKKKETKKLNSGKLSPSKVLQSFLKNLSHGKDQANEKRLVLENLNKVKNYEVNNEENIKYFKRIFFSLKKERFISLYDLGIISKIIPEFSKIAYLPQFDRFHSLTVGQHTLRALNILKDLQQEKIKKNQYNFFYKELKKKFNKKALHYATLLHDIGKGRGGEHNKKGAEIAKKVVLRCREKYDIAYETSWLVHHHSLLSNIAFNKDLEDHSIIRKTAEKIKSMSRLRALFLLNITDISAVEQGLWNNWKSSLLNQLYLKLEKQIKQPRKLLSLNDKIDIKKLNILKNSKKISQLALEEIGKISYPNYWLLQSEEMIILQIENFFLGKRKDFDFIIKQSADSKFYDLILFTKDRPQLFLNLISIFVQEYLSIFEARIFTLDDGTVIDTFKFSLDNRNYNKSDAQRKMSSVKKKLNDLASNNNLNIKPRTESNQKFIKRKVDVVIDNISSATYTILNVQTNDRPNLLYEISKILIKNKIIISMAKISTYGDFVEDSFHLRSEYGLKIQNDEKIKKIKTEIENKLINKG